MRILVLDGALADCVAAVVVDGQVVARRGAGGGRGQAALLAGMARDVLATAEVAAAELDGIAVTVGPGSFTGLRAAIALAQGLGAASGRAVVGVSVPEAMGAALPRLGRRTLWVALDSRRGRVFLRRGDDLRAFGLDELPAPDGPVAVAGDAAIAVAARLAARGEDVMLTDVRRASPRAVAAVAAQRLRGELPPLPPLPLYVDPPEAKLPAGGLRPPPMEA
jgi:tRNA threonylcarbamoyl adenosine modification protein YeaZ